MRAAAFQLVEEQQGGQATRRYRRVNDRREAEDSEVEELVLEKKFVGQGEEKRQRRRWEKREDGRERRTVWAFCCGSRVLTALDMLSFLVTEQTSRSVQRVGTRDRSVADEHSSPRVNSIPDPSFHLRPVLKTRILAMSCYYPTRKGNPEPKHIPRRQPFPTVNLIPKMMAGGQARSYSQR